MKQTMIRGSLEFVTGMAMVPSGFADHDVLLNIESGSRI